MNITNIFVKTRELANSLVLKSRELINSLVFKSRELVNSLDFMKMLVLFIFRLRGIRKFLAIRILVFHLSIYYNDQCLLFRKVTILHLWRCRDQEIPGYMDISISFFKILQCLVLAFLSMSTALH